MQKDLEIGILNATYGKLLTARQREVITQYYDYDLSLMEIAENLEISRQGVLDAIKKGSEQLKLYETTLNVVASKKEMNAKLRQISDLLDCGEVERAKSSLLFLTENNQE